MFFFVKNDDYGAHITQNTRDMWCQVILMIEVKQKGSFLKLSNIYIACIQLITLLVGTKSTKMMNYACSRPICGGLPPLSDLGTLTIVFSGGNGCGMDVDLTHFAKNDHFLDWVNIHTDENGIQNLVKSWNKGSITMKKLISKLMDKWNTMLLKKKSNAIEV